ncbi:HTH cro/C1-type domain-containing protein [Bordetella tumbae]|uniref:S24 family peptidase n=1 Tax=Bordetella tumbae TaxID=1649139 RepID=UPI0039EDFC38
MDKFEIRRKRLRQLIDDKANGNNAEFARKYGYERAQISQYLSATYNRGRTPGQHVVDELERRVGLPTGWFDQTEAEAADPWPFPAIPEKEVRALSPEKLNALQGAMALAIAQLKLDIKVAPPTQPAQPSHGGLADLDSAADEFPMRIDGLPPAPWEPGGVTTKQMERERRVQFGIELSTVANVTTGDPVAANEKFEKVLELADVRLAAGDGIEADSELVTGAIQFRQSFLRSVGADRGRGRVVYAKGDSMDPNIKDGWALLVVPDDSLTIHDLVPNTVYAINYDGKMIVKVIDKDKLTGQWIARSANRKYRDFPLEAQGVSVRVLGRVVWAGGRLLEGDAARLGVA